MVIPKLFKKYYKANEVRGFEELMSPYFVDRKFKERILKSNKGRLVLCDTSNEDKRFYGVNEIEDFREMFLSQTWNNCKLEDKIKCIELFVQNYCKGKNCPEIRYVALDENEYFRVDGCFHFASNTIYVNIDKMQKLSGIEWLMVLTHECSHAIDVGKIADDISDLYNNYLSESDIDVSDQIRLSQAIMELPITGVIKNCKTGRNDIIDNALRDKILKVKNFYTPFSSMGLDENAQDVEFDMFISPLMYFVSPLERSARVQTKKYLSGLDTKFDMTYKDKRILDELIMQEECIDRVLSQAKETLFRVKDDYPSGYTSLLYLSEDMLKRKFYLERINVPKYQEKPGFEEKGRQTIAECNKIYKAMYENYCLETSRGFY